MADLCRNAGLHSVGLLLWHYRTFHLCDIMGCRTDHWRKVGGAKITKGTVEDNQPINPVAWLRQGHTQLNSEWHKFIDYISKEKILSYVNLCTKNSWLKPQLTSLLPHCLKPLDLPSAITPPLLPGQHLPAILASIQLLRESCLWHGRVESSTGLDRQNTLGWLGILPITI